LFSQLTYAPLPEWNNLFSIFFSFNKISDNDLASPWLRDGEKGYWYSRSAWALLAIAKYRKIVKGNERVQVWLPSYFCNEPIGLLRKFNAKISFYPVLYNGYPDFEACKDMLNNCKPDLFVLVHYFGELTDARESFTFAKNNGAWLIEDAAHVLTPYDGIGENGDFVFYSPHKLLPIPDGSLLVIRPIGPSGINKEDFKYHDLGNMEKELNVRTKSSCTPYIWLIKRFLQKISKVSLTRTTMGFYENDHGKGMKEYIRPKMSLLAKNLLAVMINNLDEEIIKRRENLNGWIKYLSLSGILEKKVSQILEIETPYLAVLKFSKSNNAEKAYNSLLKVKVPVSTWPDLPPEVLSENQKHKVAVSMRNQRIFLTVHKSNNIKSIKQTLNKI